MASMRSQLVRPALLALLLPAVLNARQSPAIAVRDVAVLTMVTPEIRKHLTVVVDRGRIVAIGPAASTAIPAGAFVVDGSGRTLMPGLIDAHVHLRRADIPAYLASGILTVRNMWGHPGIRTMQQEIAAGSLRGPTIQTYSPGLDGSPASWPFTQFVDNPADADSVVALQQSNGYDILKIYQRLSLAAFDSIVAAARRRHLRYAGHVPTAVPIRHALDAGLLTIEHYTGYDLALSTNGQRGTFGWMAIDTSRFAALVAATVSSGTWNCPTLAIYAQFAARQDAGSAQVIANRRRFTAALHGAGARLVAGTDAGIGVTAPGTSLLLELQEFVASGLSNWEALRLATVASGELLGVPQLGTIAVGAPGELLLLDGNPLEDLHALRRPSGVLLHQEWIDAAALATAQAPSR